MNTKIIFFYPNGQPYRCYLQQHYIYLYIQRIPIEIIMSEIKISNLLHYYAGHERADT